MTQCVPSWDLDDVNNPTPLKLAFCPPSNSFTQDVPSLDYEVAELTWENGQLSMYGLGGGTPRLQLTKSAWDKPRAADTLECIVNQATANPHSKPKNTVPWLDHRRATVKPAASAAMDALVPCRVSDDSRLENSATHVLGTGTCMAGSCSGAAASVGGLAPVGRGGCCKSYASVSVSESATFGGGETSRQVTLDSSDREFGGGGGLTSTSLWSPGNTSSGKDNSKTSAEDSVCHSRSQRQAGDKGNRKLGIGKTSVSAKSRAAVHNQSERRRRDKINQRMKTLQKLVPNSSKTDKASMLDEVIEYLKQLQAQIQMMSRMNMPSMMMPMTMPMPMQQHLQMSMMPPPVPMAAMGMGMPGMPPMMPTPAAAAASFMPPWDIQTTAASDRMQFPQLTPDFLSAFLACQSQPTTTTMEAYSRLAAMYQQFQQSSAGSASKN